MCFPSWEDHGDAFFSCFTTSWSFCTPSCFWTYTHALLSAWSKTVLSFLYLANLQLSVRTPPKSYFYNTQDHDSFSSIISGPFPIQNISSQFFLCLPHCIFFCQVGSMSISFRVISPAPSTGLTFDI